MNNMEFPNPIAPLPAGKEDEQSLYVLFKILAFDVRIHRNLTAQEMVDKADHYRKMKHKGVFFLIILSHGSLVKHEEIVVGTDGDIVSVNYLESLFHANNCPSLHGVPKIFMIDACRGGQQERAFESQHKNMHSVAKHSDIWSPDQYSLAGEQPGTDSANFAILYASTHGNVSYITGKGSQLTQTFVEVTSEASLDKTFIQIVQEVQTRIQDSRMHQTVELVDRLNRPYFIKRFVPPNSLQSQVENIHYSVFNWLN